MRKNIFLSILTLVLSSCSVIKNQVTFPDVDDIEIPVDHDYSEVSDFMIDWNDMFDFDLDEYFVYFYSTDCSHCIEIKNEIVEIALEKENIYFVKSSSKVRLTKDVNSTIGATFAGDISILGYPSLIKIVDGICVKNVAGKTAILSALH